MNGSSFLFTFTVYGAIGPAKDMYFAIIFVTYLVSVVINIALMALICLDTSLHKPMFIFLCSVILNGLIGSTAVWPKVMSHLATDIHSVSFEICFIQTFFSCAYGGCNFFMLTVMAYDRYVSIFQPLLYHTIMTPQKVKVLVVVGNLLPAVAVFTQLCLTSRIPLCRYSIPKIFCDNLAVLNLGCVRNNYSLMTNVFGVCMFGLFLVVPILLVLWSYLKIIILTSKLSADARRKTFATCTPHIIIFLNFTLSSLFSLIYNRVDAANLPKEGHIFVSALYIIVPPLLHPIVYGMKNKEIRRSLLKITGTVFPLHRHNFQLRSTVIPYS
ncbi:olfactory receptor 52E4-like [Sardina pilchardus]|uniref:olfactory receptor 52E4-like n=1 Tax=Sardina pilchardus TaxID=27697 RepID=UPI002E1443CF